MAQHLCGNPTPQYLNAMTIATHMAIADIEATSIFIMEGTNMANSLSQLIYLMGIK
jgi:hypothetical protein